MSDDDLARAFREEAAEAARLRALCPKEYEEVLNAERQLDRAIREPAIGWARDRLHQARARLDAALAAKGAA